jgi:TonB family protein
MLRRRALLAGSLLSAVIHALVAVVLVQLPSASELARRDRLASYEVVVDAVGTRSGTPGAPARGSAPSEADRATPGGADSRQNIHARDLGQGGDRTGADEGIRLLQRDDGIVLFDSPLNNLAAAQTQRIRTARDRATLERRRATPSPADDVFLASGPGTHAERRPVSAVDSAIGARDAPEATVQGARPSQARVGPQTGAEEASGSGDVRMEEARIERASAASPEQAGGRASPGRGILGGEGSRRSEAARVAHGRPSVDEGPAATHAETQDSRVRDATDAELLARSMMQSWVEATARTGEHPGTGRGGVGGGGTPGSGGGTREGGRATTYGPGAGDYSALDTSDGRYRRWFLDQRRRVENAVRFPRERALQMDQGTSIYSIVVRRDGTLASAPRLVRSSGFDDMDRAALAAIQSVTPFAPLPADLAPELSEIRVRLPVEFSNPMVR